MGIFKVYFISDFAASLLFSTMKCLVLWYIWKFLCIKLSTSYLVSFNQPNPNRKLNHTDFFDIVKSSDTHRNCIETNVIRWGFKVNRYKSYFHDTPVTSNEVPGTVDIVWVVLRISWVVKNSIRIGNRVDTKCGIYSDAVGTTLIHWKKRFTPTILHANVYVLVNDSTTWKGHKQHKH